MGGVWTPSQTAFRALVRPQGNRVTAPHPHSFYCHCPAITLLYLSQPRVLFLEIFGVLKVLVCDLEWKGFLGPDKSAPPYTLRHPSSQVLKVSLVPLGSLRHLGTIPLKHRYALPNQCMKKK